MPARFIVSSLPALKAALLKVIARGGISHLLYRIFVEFLSQMYPVYRRNLLQVYSSLYLLVKQRYSPFLCNIIF